jgi:predicted Zn finger-like uncharacterized protein
METSSKRTTSSAAVSIAAAAFAFLDMEAEIGDLEGGYGSVRFGLMILTCPECATSYFVDDARIPSDGRTVKCTSCGNRWKAVKDEAGEAQSPLEPEVSAEEPEADAAKPIQPAAETALDDDLEVTGPEVTPAPRAALRPAPPAKREAANTVAMWVAMAAMVAALIAGAIVFRGQVVRLWPASSAAYAGVGLSVEGLGLVIEQVKAEAVLQGGRPVLSVTGAIRNVGDHAADSPAIRINLLDKKGRPIAAKIARPLDGRIPAKARRHFAIAIIDPPSTAKDLEVAFDVLEPRTAVAAAPAGAPHAAEAVLAPAPVEAQPLPVGSPDALDHHG